MYRKKFVFLDLEEMKLRQSELQAQNPRKKKRTTCSAKSRRYRV